MKNIRIIDGADNTTCSIFAATDEEFAVIFPGGTDIEFAEDFFERAGDEIAGECCTQYEDGTVSAYPLYEQMTGGCRRLRHSAAHAR